MTKKCKIAPHVSYAVGDVIQALINQLKCCPYIKLQGMAASDEGLCRNIKTWFPGAIIVARYYDPVQSMGSTLSSAYMSGIAYCSHYFYDLAPVRLGLVDYIETFNERLTQKQLDDPHLLGQFIEHHRGFFNELQKRNKDHGTNVKGIALNLANGNLPVNSLEKFSALFQWFGDFGVHAYGYPTLQNHLELVYQYKTFVKQIRQAFGNDHPYKVWITECGVTTAVEGRGDNGWRNFLRPGDYVSSIVAFNMELTEPEVPAAFVFDIGGGDYWTHELFPIIMMGLSDTPWSLVGVEEKPPDTPPPPPPDDEDCYRNGVYAGIGIAYERIKGIFDALKEEYGES